MSSNRITPPAKVSELTADQLDLVHGGIIIVGGKTSRSDAILSFAAAGLSGGVMAGGVMAGGAMGGIARMQGYAF